METFIGTESVISEVLYQVIILLIPVLVGFIINLAKKYLNITDLKNIQEELITKQELVKVAITFVQQAYSELGGEKKYDLAVSWLTDELAKRKIKITDDEIKALIESTLKSLKAEFGQQWDKVKVENK